MASLRSGGLLKQAMQKVIPGRDEVPGTPEEKKTKSRRKAPARRGNTMGSVRTPLGMSMD